uniref:F-box domain-containing protein n=1 Tax=Plectus sambesii TaxID=2011161 RepID=A0A914WPN7_9BILA
MVENASWNDLPLEVKEVVLWLIPPAERRNLRLVDKTMRSAVSSSMRDISEIAVSHSRETSNSQTKTATGGRRVMMKTINPFTGTTADYNYKITSSSLPFLLKWAGIRATSLVVTTNSCFTSDDSRLDTVRGVFEALNAAEGACTKLEQLNVASCRLIFNNADVLGDLLEYVTKRQSVAEVGGFLRSLSLSALPKCCNRSILPPTTTADINQTYILLQRVLDQCHGLKTVNVNSLIKPGSSPGMALRYPKTVLITANDAEMNESL